MSRDIPILMSAPMVRATLSGTKTQTRRVLKQANGPSLSVGMDEAAPGVAELSWLYGDGPGHEVYEAIKRVRCPYGAPGDRLWVREAWRSAKSLDILAPRDLLRESPLWYEADGAENYAVVAEVDKPGRLRASMHMPRAASRITLEVTDVRVERLQEISEADAIAEGIERTVIGDDWRRYSDTASELAGLPPCLTPRASYQSLWELINGPGSWEANPWVWVVEFRRV